MRNRFAALPLACLLVLPALASAELTKKDQTTLRDAVKVLDAVAKAADKGIPQELLAKADCILIFPSVDKDAFVVGGGRGDGIASCRQKNGEMGPASFYTLGGASAGSKIGGTTNDVVMLVMNAGRITNLLESRFTIGSEATVIAGPVGSPVPAAADAKTQANILAWARSRGGFEGAVLDGSVVKLNEGANARLYGGTTSGKEILMGSTLAVPEASRPLLDAIRRQMAPEK